MKPLQTLLGALLLATLAAGCETYLTGGNPVNPIASRSLTVGLSYDEVISELGATFLSLDGQRVIAYPWDTSHGDMTLAPVDENGMLHPEDGVAIQDIGARYYALCLRFDANQRLQAWTNLVTANQHSLRQAMRVWAGTPVR